MIKFIHFKNIILINKTKYFGIATGIFVIFVIVGIAYESTTGLNMLTGERKTSGAGADKWIEEEKEIVTSKIITPISTVPSCDSSYPDFCISPNSSDLDCGEIPYKSFRVIGSDKHGFDRDNDGIGCE